MKRAEQLHDETLKRLQDKLDDSVQEKDKLEAKIIELHDDLEAIGAQCEIHENTIHASDNEISRLCHPSFLLSIYSRRRTSPVTAMAS